MEMALLLNGKSNQRMDYQFCRSIRRCLNM